MFGAEDPLDLTLGGLEYLESPGSSRLSLEMPWRENKALIPMSPPIPCQQT